ncbi:hypothetical protein [Bacillus cereus]|uniref:hypothetical protein n=1 Tax=Bacillus cereus TaxID=1396 RepID=UPI000BF9F81A|nr:hypothetical protein [Bacillus cereus]PFA61473.1 hypothetical protein CN403_32170 [Bacillus cereus]
MKKTLYKNCWFWSIILIIVVITSNSHNKWENSTTLKRKTSKILSKEEGFKVVKISNTNYQKNSLTTDGSSFK